MKKCFLYYMIFLENASPDLVPRNFRCHANRKVITAKFLFIYHTFVFDSCSPSSTTMSDMHVFRNKLIQDSLYLGTTAIRDKVVWRRIGRETCLVTKASATAHDAAQPKDSTESQTQATDDASDSTLPDPIAPLIPATLTMVALISSENIWLVEDGHWKGPTAYTKSFDELKLTCLMVSPMPLPNFATDFPNVLHNVRWLMQQTETKGNNKQGVLNPKEKPTTSIKLRHILFEVSNTFDD
jgi:hypothetical protein